MGEKRKQFSMYFPDGVKEAIQDNISHLNEGKVSVKDFLMLGLFVLTSEKYPDIAALVKDHINEELKAEVRSIKKKELLPEVIQAQNLLNGILEKLDK